MYFRNGYLLKKKNTIKDKKEKHTCNINYTEKRTCWVEKDTGLGKHKISG
jgi:hypothetical protein